MKNFLLALLAIILLIPVSCREAGEFSSERLHKTEATLPRLLRILPE